MRENTDQKNSEYKHFLRSVKHVLVVMFYVIPGIYFFTREKIYQLGKDLVQWQGKIDNKFL